MKLHVITIGWVLGFVFGLNWILIHPISTIVTAAFTEACS